MTRLEILRASLAKKEAAFDAALQSHMDDVRSANGQPLNDKRNGNATMRRWDKQDDALRTKKEGIKKTKAAIEREEFKARVKVRAYADFPACIQELIDSGKLTIWRKHPSYLFVAGVEKARIRYERGVIYACHYKDLSAEEYAIFRDTFNAINKKLRDEK